MAPEIQAAEVTDAETEAIEIRLVLEAIYAKHGYDLRGYSDPSMRRRIHALLARLGLTRLSDLQHRILREPELLSAVLNGLTVRVSELFRDPTFFLDFRSRVVPILRTYPLLKIWLAGCASGEEAYAMAIVLTEEGLYDRAQIYATDLSASALEQAKQGVYAAEHIEQFEDNYRRAGGSYALAQYYMRAYDGIAFTEPLRRNILFFQHNLVSDHAFGEMNVIFCRNVFIYFGAELRARVLSKLAQSLCPGGFLCLGQSERLARADGEQPFERVGGSEPIYRYTAM
jgi:chemotaxis protein methyltransferase CheR